MARRRVRSNRVALARPGFLLAATLLTGCDGQRPAPTPDHYQPSRPTNTGSLSDALRRAPARVLAQTPRVSGGDQVQSAPDMPDSPPERLDEATRSVVERYLDTVAQVNTTLESLSDPALAPDAMKRLAPLADEWRAAMDHLAMAPEDVAAQIRRDYGPRLRLTGDLLSQNLARLEGKPAFAGVLTLVSDLPTMSGHEPTPPPPTGPQGPTPPIHATALDAGSPGR